MPITQAQKTSLELVASELEQQIAALVVDPETPTGPTQEQLDAALAQRDAALAQVAQMQAKIDAARQHLRAAAEADAIEDAGRAGALASLGD